MPDPDESTAYDEGPSWFSAAKEAVEIIRSGLQRGQDGIPLHCDELLCEVLESIENFAPLEPEFPDFDTRFGDNAYFTASDTMLGLSVEIYILRIFWLSKNPGSSVYDDQRAALGNSPEFKKFSGKVLGFDSRNGKIVRVIFGRYLNWLIYFGEDWVQSQFHSIFPEDAGLRGAAWEGHLLHDNRPAQVLVTEMEPLYRQEILRLSETQSPNERRHREDRFTEYLIVLYLWDSLAPDLLEQFWTAAPQNLRKHVIWFLGRELCRGSDVPPDVRARGEAYWYARLSAAEKAEDKDLFCHELGAIGNWAVDGGILPSWLLAQMHRMLQAGYAPSHSYTILKWAANICSEYVGETVDLVDGLLRNQSVEFYTLAVQQSEIRKILIAGRASADAGIRDRATGVISIFAAKGHTSFLDLLDSEV